mgnify:CR=1 FL=1
MAADLYRVLAWTGAKVEQLSESPDRDVAKKMLRAAVQPAALVHGAKVLELNARGKSHERAFTKFATNGPASPDGSNSSKLSKTSKPLPPQTPAEPMPERESVAPVVEPSRLVVSVKRASISVEVDDEQPAPAPARPPEVTHAIDPTSGATVIGSPDHEELAIERPHTVSRAAARVDNAADANALQCSKCGEEPRAGVTRRTNLGEETWGRICRKRADETRRKQSQKASAPAAKDVITQRDAKPAKPTPKPQPAAPRATSKPAPQSTEKPTPKLDAAASAATTLSLDDALGLIEKHASLIGRLGGLARAEELADVVEENGGPSTIVTAIRRVMAVGGR